MKLTINKIPLILSPSSTLPQDEEILVDAAIRKTMRSGIENKLPPDWARQKIITKSQTPSQKIAFFLLHLAAGR